MILVFWLLASCRNVANRTGLKGITTQKTVIDFFIRREKLRCQNYY